MANEDRIPSLIQAIERDLSDEIPGGRQGANGLRSKVNPCHCSEIARITA